MAENNYNNGYGGQMPPYQNNQYNNPYPGGQYPVNPYPGPQYPADPYQRAPESNVNGFGIAGFVLSILGVIFSWAPFLNFALWFLGLAFSIVGLCVKKSKALAFAGLIISLVDLILLLLVIGFFGLLVTGAAASAS